MPGQDRGRGRSASRWIAMATCVVRRWSPAAGSSLQLTASKTQTPLSKDKSLILIISMHASLFTHAVSVDILMLVHGGPTWECER